MYFTADTYTQDELKAEYKKLAKKLHPDKNKGDHSKFQEMQAEYEKIKEESKYLLGPWRRIKPVQFTHISEFDFKKYQTQKPTHEVTPEEVKAAAEAIATLFNLFNKGKKR